MHLKKIFLFTLILSGSLKICSAQSWVDTLDQYARERHLPAYRYLWTWQNAALLKTMVKQYDMRPEPDNRVYFNYIQRAMRVNWLWANGNSPNAVASGLGMAFLYRETGNKRYLRKSEKIYRDYLGIRRTDEGAVSHLKLFTELWDDTVFMLGQFFLEMYRATGNEKYINEFHKQFTLHREQLLDKESGLWIHGWSTEDSHHISFCSQRNWPDPETGRSAEIWGRGTGWVIVTLADYLLVLPETHPLWDEFAGYLLEMVERLPEWQDEQTGHWYQLAVKPEHPDNFIESSATAMFAYGITAAIKLGLLTDDKYKNSVKLAYHGLSKYSIKPKRGRYLTTKNVCIGTCIGDEQYYLNRGVREGTSFGIGSFIQFGLLYEKVFSDKFEF